MLKIFLRLVKPKIIPSTPCLPQDLMGPYFTVQGFSFSLGTFPVSSCTSCHSIPFHSLLYTTLQTPSAASNKPEVNLFCSHIFLSYFFSCYFPLPSYYNSSIYCLEAGNEITFPQKIPLTLTYLPVVATKYTHTIFH